MRRDNDWSLTESGFLVYNPAAGTYLSPGSWGTGAGWRGGQGVTFTTYFSNYNLVADPYDEQDITPAQNWKKEGRITFFNVIPCGRIEVPFDFNNVDLTPSDP